MRDALFHRTPSKNIVRGAPEIARQAIVMRTNDARGPGGRIAERLEQITEERIGEATSFVERSRARWELEAE